MAIFGPSPGFKEIICASSGFSIEGTLNSASAVPHCGISQGAADIYSKDPLVFNTVPDSEPFAAM